MRDNVELVVLEMTRQFGDIAMYLDRDLAERAEGHRPNTAQAWHD
jgi:hypothetical protein